MFVLFYVKIKNFKTNFSLQKKYGYEENHFEIDKQSLQTCIKYAGNIFGILLKNISLLQHDYNKKVNLTI